MFRRLFGRLFGQKKLQVGDRVRVIILQPPNTGIVEAIHGNDITVVFDKQPNDAISRLSTVYSSLDVKRL